MQSVHIVSVAAALRCTRVVQGAETNHRSAPLFVSQKGKCHGNSNARRPWHERQNCGNGYSIVSPTHVAAASRVRSTPLPLLLLHSLHTTASLGDVQKHEGASTPPGTAEEDSDRVGGATDLNTGSAPAVYTRGTSKEPPAAPYTEHKLFVGQIPKDWEEAELQQVLEEFGPLAFVSILRYRTKKEKQRDSRGRSMGCGFVTYVNLEDQQKAIEGLHLKRTLDRMDAPMVLTGARPPAKTATGNASARQAIPPPPRFITDYKKTAHLLPKQSPKSSPPLPGILYVDASGDFFTFRDGCWEMMHFANPYKTEADVTDKRGEGGLSDDAFWSWVYDYRSVGGSVGGWCMRGKTLDTGSTHSLKAPGCTSIAPLWAELTQPTISRRWVFSFNDTF